MNCSSTSKQRSRSGFQPQRRYAAMTLVASMSAAFAGPAIGGSESEVFSLHAKAPDGKQITVEPSAAKGMGYAAGYAIVDGHAVFEGDMVLARVDDPAMRNWLRGLGVSSAFARWTNGIIPYQFSAALSTEEIAMVREAIQHWNDNTTITLLEITDENRSTFENFVTFETSNGCSSYVGMIGGEQELWVSATCGVGSVIHEIGHTVGLFHEHTRIDRDNYISVAWDNITPNSKFNFETLDAGTNLLGDYDYGSIMHYGESFFSINGENTITVLDGVSEIGQRVALSEKDIASVNSLYATDVAVTLTTAINETEGTLRADVQLTNLGEMGAHRLELTLDAGENANWTAISAGADWQCGTRNSELLCTLNTLSAGDNKQFSVLGNVNGSSQNAVSVVVVGKSYDVDYSNNAINEVASPDSKNTPDTNNPNSPDSDGSNSAPTENTAPQNNTPPAAEPDSGAAEPKNTPMTTTAGGAMSPFAALILLFGITFNPRRRQIN